MILVCSAGNAGAGSWKKITPPGDADHVLTTGAIDKKGLLASFSSIGNTADEPDKTRCCGSRSGIGRNGYRWYHTSWQWYLFCLAHPLRYGYLSLAVSSGADCERGNRTGCNVRATVRSFRIIFTATVYPICGMLIKQPDESTPVFSAGT